MQVALLVVTAALLARLFQVRASAAALGYWQALLVVCLVLPICQRWQEPAAAPAFESTIRAASHSPSPQWAVASRAASPWPSREGRVSEGWAAQAVLWAIAAATALRGAWLGLGLWSLRRLRRNAAPLPVGRLPVESAQQRVGTRAEFYISPATKGPIAFGLRRPRVLLPPAVLEMEAKAQEAILYHELLHVRRRDWVCVVLEESARALLWFHPAIAWLVGRIQLTREQVVDRAVIDITRSRETYVEALLSVARARSDARLIPAPLFLRKGLLKKRVAEILRETKMTTRRLLAFAGTSAGTLLLVGVAAARLFPLEARAADKTEPVQVTRGGENLLHKAPVAYPRRAIEKKVEGEVELELSLDEQGLVFDARVLSGPEELRAAALQSVLEWHYGPPTPLPGSTQVAIEFRLPKPDESRGVDLEVLWTAPFEGHVLEEHGVPAERARRQKVELEKAFHDAEATEEERASWNRQIYEMNRKLEDVRALEKGREQKSLAELHKLAEVEARSKRQREERHRALEGQSVLEQQAALAKLHASAELEANSKRQLEETHAQETLRAELYKSAEHEANWKRRLQELRARMDNMASAEQRQEWKQRIAEIEAKVDGEDRAARRLEVELAKALDAPGTSGEHRAEYNEKMHAMNRKIASVQQLKREVRGTLTSIRADGVSEAALKLLMPRLGVAQGDLITPEIADQIQERVRSVDEHLRVEFHLPGEGRVMLVIVGP